MIDFVMLVIQPYKNEIWLQIKYGYKEGGDAEEAMTWRTEKRKLIMFMMKLSRNLIRIQTWP